MRYVTVGSLDPSEKESYLLYQDLNDNPDETITKSGCRRERYNTNKNQTEEHYDAGIRHGNRELCLDLVASFVACKNRSCIGG
jgi:hypothetical protein